MNNKVIHVIVGLTDGGAEGVLTRLCINRQRCDHIVISLTGMGKYGKLLEDAGFPVHCLNLDKGIFKWTGIIKLAYLIKVNKPVALQTWMYHSDLLGGLVARLVGVRDVYWGIRHSELDKTAGKRLTVAIASLCAYLSKTVPKRILCCANSSVLSHVRVGYEGSKMTVIPNGYDLNKFFPDSSKRDKFRNELDINASTFLIGYVGRFHKDKGHESLLQALSIVKSRDLNWRCVLVGRDVNEENESLCEALRVLGLQDLVIPLGARDDIPVIMNGLDLHVLPSLAEGFPNVLAEAMACGTVCVSTDVGDASEIILSEDSLCKPNAPDELANVILKLARENKLSPARWNERRKAGSIKIQEQFSLERMVQAYEKVWLS